MSMEARQAHMPKRYEKEIEDILRGAERSAGSDNSGWQKRDRARWKQKRAARPWRIRIAYDISTILLFSGVGLILLAYLINSHLHLAATLIAISGVILFLSPIALSIRQSTTGNAQYWRGQPVSGKPYRQVSWQQRWRALQRAIGGWFGKGPK